MTPAAITKFGCLLLVVSVTAALAGAGEPSPKEKPAESAQKAAVSSKTDTVRSPYVQAATKRPKRPGTKTYSNEDLERMFGGGVPRAATPVAEGSPGPAGTADGAKSPLEQVLEQERLAEERRRQIVAGEKKVAEARQRIVDLERRTLALKNPLWGARPAPPEEGREEWDQMDGRQRVNQADAQVEAARQDLALAQRELAELLRSDR